MTKGEITMKKAFKLSELDCGHCAQEIEDAVAKLDGVTKVRVNFMSQRMTLEADDARGCINLARRLERSDKKQAAALRQKAQKLHEKECEAGLAKKCMEFKKSTNKGEKHEF